MQLILGTKIKKTKTKKKTDNILTPEPCNSNFQCGLYSLGHVRHLGIAMATHPTEIEHECQRFTANRSHCLSHYCDIQQVRTPVAAVGYYCFYYYYY